MVDVTQVKLAVDSTDVTKATKNLQGMQTAGQNVEKSAGGMGRSLGRSFSPATTAKIQNASFQLQDIAVQLEMGTSATRALGQQLPQLLGAFGALGAVLGTVVGIGLPLAAMFFDSGDGADAAADATEKYEDALQDLKDIQEELARVEAERNGNLDAFIKKQSLANLEGQIKIAQQALSALYDEAAKFNIEAGDIPEFDQRFDEANAALAEANKNLSDASSGLDKIAANEAFIKKKDDATELLAELQPLVTAQEKLRQEEELLNFAQQNGMISLQQKVTLMDRLREQYEDQLDPLQASLDALQEEEDLLRMGNLERRVETRLRKEIEEITKAGQELKKIDIDLLRQEIEANEILKDKVKEKKKADEEAAREAKKFADKVEDAFGAVGDQLFEAVKGTKTLAQSFKDMTSSILNNIAEMMFQKAITNPLQEALGGIAGSVLGSIFPFANGGVISNGVQKFANGGVVNSPTFFPMANGHTGLMGEAGPEAIVPLPDGRSIPVQMSGGGGGTVVNIIDQRTGDKAPVETQETRGPNGKRQITVLIRDTVRRGLSNGEYDAALSGRFGSSPATIRRG